MGGIIPVLMCGGSGTRLWPLSRSHDPKPFHAFSGEQSLFRQTLDRFSSAEYVEPIILLNNRHRDLVLRELAFVRVGAARLLMEPSVQGTAPAIAAAAALIAERDPSGLMLVAPSDHCIDRIDLFAQSVDQARESAQRGRIVLFGVQPTYDEPGFGYIETGDALAGEVLEVLGFIEKPGRARAGALISSGRTLWNSGIFLFQAAVILEELQRYAPEVCEWARLSLKMAERNGNTISLSEDFCRAPHVSIDHAVMEHSTRLACVPFKAGWRDLGTWSSLWEAGEKDRGRNVVIGDAVLHDVRNSYVHGSSRLIALTGVEGLIVVDTDDALLVGTMDQAQSVAQVASELARAERSEALAHRKVQRPWGMYEPLKEGEQYRVKHLVVDVAGCLSLQYHLYRSEHWVVVSGTARVRIGDRDFIMTANDSAYIPIGTVHRLENIGDEELQLIEVQYGDRLLEDDIVRLEDRYGRHSAAG